MDAIYMRAEVIYNEARVHARFVMRRWRPVKWMIVITANGSYVETAIFSFSVWVIKE